MIQINFIVLSWLFAISITVHNIEEAIWLPKWSISAKRWHHPVNPRVFRFAVLILTIFAYITSILASLGEKQGIGAYLVSGYALAMLLNVVFPHLIATGSGLGLGSGHRWVWGRATVTYWKIKKRYLKTPIFRS